MGNESRTVQAGGSATPASSERGDEGLRRGENIGRYCILNRVGSGGMGIVYAAYDPKLDRRVAIKVLRTRGGVDVTAALLQEAQSLARLNHPNVVQIYDTGEHERGVFFAMEFVEGKSLRAWLSDSTPPQAQLLATFRSAALGLGAVHRAGIVHGDFKPDNVMLANDGRVLVADFGLATEAGKSQVEEVDGAPSILGTPAYMAPEQFLGHPALPASDQFAFCVALYEALAGERPFKANSLAELSSNVVAGRIAHDPPMEDAPRWLRNIVLTGLSREPDERHPSMDAMSLLLVRGQRRHRWVAALAVVPLVGAAALFGVAKPNLEEAKCRADASRLGETWETQLRSNAQRSIADELDIDSNAAWAAIESGVDTYVASWANAYDAACSARYTTQTIEVETFDARVHCLDNHAEYLTTLLGDVGSPQAASVAEIAVHAAELPRVTECETPVAAEARGETRADVWQAQRQFALAQAFADGGQQARAREALAVGLALVPPGTAPRTRAALLAESSRQHYSQGALEEAQDALKLALEEATRSRDAKFTTELWSLRIAHLLEDHRDIVAAAALLEVVAASAAAAGDDPLTRSRLAFARAAVAADQSQWIEARGFSRDALAALRDGDADARALSITLDVLATAESETGMLQEARAHEDEAIAILRATYEDRHPAMPALLHNRGVICRRAEDLACAKDSFERALDLSPKRSAARGRRLVSLAQIEFDANHIEVAERLANEAVELYSSQFGPEYAGLTAPILLLFNIAKYGDDPDTIRSTATRVVEVAEASRPPKHPSRGFAYSTMGEAMRLTGDLDAALEWHERALALRTEILDPGARGIAISTTLLATTHLAAGNSSEALALAERAIALLDATTSVSVWRADARFVAARAVQDTDPDRATSLAADALQRYQAVGDREKKTARDVRKWLEDAATKKAPPDDRAVPSTND